MGGLVDFIMNIDAQLRQAVDNYGPWIYLLMFLIVFSETGLIV